MKKFSKLLIAFVVGLVLFCGIAYWQGLLIPAFGRGVPGQDESILGKVRNDKAKLRTFLLKMPKGAELLRTSAAASPQNAC